MNNRLSPFLPPLFLPDAGTVPRKLVPFTHRVFFGENRLAPATKATPSSGETFSFPDRPDPVLSPFAYAPGPFHHGIHRPFFPHRFWYIL